MANLGNNNLNGGDAPSRLINTESIYQDGFGLFPGLFGLYSPSEVSSLSGSFHYNITVLCFFLSSVGPTQSFGSS
jgi:hypothetical protein